MHVQVQILALDPTSPIDLQGTAHNASVICIVRRFWETRIQQKRPIGSESRDLSTCDFTKGSNGYPSAGKEKAGLQQYL